MGDTMGVSQKIKKNQWSYDHQSLSDMQPKEMKSAPHRNLHQHGHYISHNSHDTETADLSTGR
jgi:hypothetical protein